MHETTDLVEFVKEALDRKQAELGEPNDEKFAELLGVDYTTLYRIKKGNNWPRSLRAVVRALVSTQNQAA